jgi:hypothetical protein
MNATAPQTVCIGTFPNRRRAEHFVEELKHAGFHDEEIGVLTPKVEPPADVAEDASLAGALTGGTMGAFAGLALVAGLVPGVGPMLAGGLLAGSLGGAALGSVLGGLLAHGLTEEEAREHEGQLRAGRSLVVVQAMGRTAEALAILRQSEEDKAGGHG